jgi:hypothetical protein
MTLGFAAFQWGPEGHRDVYVAADTRISLGPHTVDAGLKTYELGDRCAMVAAGAALPPMTAADLTRSLVEGHNRSSSTKVGFFNTVRILSILLLRVAKPYNANCRVAVAGFLRDGSPCLALIQISPQLNKVCFRKAIEGASAAFPVGDDNAARLLLTAMAAARAENRSPLGAALNMLIYIAKHEGMWESVGGALSLGACSAGAQAFEWPIVRVHDRYLWRGIDVTDHYGAGWPTAAPINYDESWCAKVDRTSDSERQVALEIAGSLPGFDIVEQEQRGDLLQMYEELDL